VWGRELNKTPKFCIPIQCFFGGVRLRLLIELYWKFLISSEFKCGLSPDGGLLKAINSFLKSGKIRI
jgi:hypothetical protein